MSVFVMAAVFGAVCAFVTNYYTYQGSREFTTKVIIQIDRWTDGQMDRWTDKTYKTVKSEKMQIIIIVVILQTSLRWTVCSCFSQNAEFERQSLYLHCIRLMVHWTTLAYNSHVTFSLSLLSVCLFYYSGICTRLMVRWTTLACIWSTPAPAWRLSSSATTTSWRRLLYR